MTMLAQARPLFAFLVLAFAMIMPAWAQELVSVRNPTVNLRAAPSTDAQILFRLSQGYPLQVLERRGNWLRVQDFEGDQGWIARSVTANVPHHIVKGTRVNLRSGPGTNHAIVGTVNYGEVLRTVRRQGNWVLVQNPNGRGNAWVASNFVWGW